MAPPLPVRCCLATVRWVPVVFITAVVVWSYYAYVIIMCLFTVQNTAEKIVYLVLYHPILFMFGWAYGKTIFTEPGSVPKQFFLSPSDIERFENAENEVRQREILDHFGRNLPLHCRTNTGAMRYCEKCKCIKPDRAHHCSVCSKCVLKMDHHCPWVNNCVCFTNYKFFLLFLGYALVYCVYVAITSIKYFIAFWANIGGPSEGGATSGGSAFHILFLFFAAVMFAISLVSLFGYHCYLVSVNRSTLESFRAPVFRSGPDKDGFSLGRHGNFLEIFGDNRKMWFMPAFSSGGDGVSFPTRVPQPNNYQTMDSTPTSAQPSMGDGVNFPVRTIDEDYDSLLGQRQRWMEEGDGDAMGGYENKVALENTRT